MMASSLWFSPILGGTFSSSLGVRGGKRTHLVGRGGREGGRGGREGGREGGRDIFNHLWAPYCL